VELQSVAGIGGAGAGRPKLGEAAYLLTFGSAVSILFSIALSQFLLGLAILLLLLRRQKLQFPPIRLPLFLFVALTVLAVLLSSDPAGGFPQIKKFYVFAILPMVFTTFTKPKQIRSLVVAWSGIGFLSAVAGILQYVHRYHLALEQYAYDYGFFLDGRITGFASHWMTFGGEQMIVLLLLLSYLLFAAQGSWRWLGYLCLIGLWASIVLGLTRSIFLLGMPVGAFYLLWRWKRWVAGLIPGLVILLLCIGPVQVRERIVSSVTPHRELDSNTHRIITRRTGWQMVRQHPWFGLGPEQIGPQFLRYLPADIPRPLPKGYYGHLHNIYLQFAAERGIPTLIVLLWLIGKALKDFYQGTIRHPRNPDLQFALHGGIAVIVAVLLEGFFEYNLGDSEVLTLFLTTIACGYLALSFAADPRLSPDQMRLATRSSAQSAPTGDLLHQT
jgi:putative inorganic carbon (hco3(-)) transporter